MLVGCMLLAGGCFLSGRIRGDGELVTKEIAISDYEAIRSQGGVMEVDYRQSDDTPGLTVTVDRNIFEMYDFHVHDGELRIEPKEKHKRERFVPTRFTVVTNSTGLRRVNASGKTQYTVSSPLRTDELKFNLAGSAKVDLKDSVMLRKLSIDIAGSGTLNALYLAGETFDGHIAGSGKMNLGGQVARTSFEIAGSGTVHAFELQTENTKCGIAGSGNIEISANNSLHVDVAGSGNVRYRGNPQLKTDIAGSGSIRKAD
jgi:hypothetical protein